MVYIEKSYPAPKSLAIEKSKANGKYDKDDVYELIVKDFKNKCYICEYKVPTTINIEHFIPHKGDVELKFDWDNLFLSCGHCNNTKSVKYNNILKCTVKEDDVENKLKYIFDLSTNKLIEKVVIDALDNSTKTNNTMNLLLAVYNGTGTDNKKYESANLRQHLRDEIKKFNTLLQNYFVTDSMEEKEYYLNEIKEHLSRSSNFTAFKRWIIKNNPKLKEEFEKYFDL